MKILFVFLFLVAVVQAELYKMTNTERQQIVNRHNYYRSFQDKTQQNLPRAANMQQMKWSSTLEQIAYRYIQAQYDGKCGGPVHNAARSVWYNQNVYVGENIAGGYGPTLIQSIDAWYDELRDSNYQFGQRFTDYNGHYTQLMWATTNLVGCAATFCTCQNCYSPILVCNYAPGGNVNNQLPFIEGYPCSQCPVSAPQCVNHELCT